MNEITKTIQIYKPEEKMPAVGCNYIATVNGYDFNDEDFHAHIPDIMCFGTISDKGEYLIIDPMACTTRMNVDEFKKRIIEWYYLPC